MKGKEDMLPAKSMKKKVRTSKPRGRVTGTTKSKSVSTSTPSRKETLEPLKIRKPEFAYLLVKMPYDVDPYLLEGTIKNQIWAMYHVEGVNFANVGEEDVFILMPDWRE